MKYQLKLELRIDRRGSKFIESNLFEILLEWKHKLFTDVKGHQTDGISDGMIAHSMPFFN